MKKRLLTLAAIGCLAIVPPAIVKSFNGDNPQTYVAPSPTPTPTPTATPSPTAQPEQPAPVVAQPQPRQPAPAYGGGTGIAILERIKQCESGGNYSAQNRSSTASGAYQFLDSTWANYAGYSRAMYAPPAVQDQKARETYNRSGTRPWEASRSCWGRYA